MIEFRLAPEAEAELDDIWLHIAREGGNIDLANSVIEDITERCWLLARYPYLGRSRGEDLRPGLRSLAVGDYIVMYRIELDDTALILHVVQGRRDLNSIVSE